MTTPERVFKTIELSEDIGEAMADLEDSLRALTYNGEDMTENEIKAMSRIRYLIREAASIAKDAAPPIE